MSPFDHPIVSARYFFPRPGAPEDWVEVAVDGAVLACSYRVVDPARPTMLHFHGNGEIVADYVPALRGWFEALGVNVFFAEYRGYGGSTGTPKLAAMLDDVSAIAEATGVAPERLVVFARSVGSIYGIELASRLPVAGLVLESGIADVLQRVSLRASAGELGVDPATLIAEAKRLFDHQAKLQAYKGRLLVMHAKHDDLVGVEHAEQNHAWSGSEDKTLVVLPRGDHNSIMFANPEAYGEALQGFLARVF